MIVRLQKVYEKQVGFYWYVETQGIFAHSIVYESKLAAVNAMIENKIDWVERRIK